MIYWSSNIFKCPVIKPLLIKDGKAAKKPGEPPKKQLSAAATTASVEAAAETKEAAMKQPAKKRNLPPGFDFIQWVSLEFIYIFTAVNK